MEIDGYWVAAAWGCVLVFFLNFIQMLVVVNCYVRIFKNDLIRIVYASMVMFIGYASWGIGWVCLIKSGIKL